MKILPTEIEGVFIIENNIFEDERGSFVKKFHYDTFKNHNLDVDFKENFYSVSHKNVIRGMHFHLPPKDHTKVIYVTTGSVLDVVVDLRKESPTYKKHVSVELTHKNHRSIYIPVGCAHGFRTLEDNTCTVYLQTGTHSPEHDTGINYNSFGFNWEIENPIVSKKDKELLELEKFDSPF